MFARLIMTSVGVAQLNMKIGRNMKKIGAITFVIEKTDRNIVH